MYFSNKKTIDDLDVSNKRVLLRCDLNVPLNAGKIADDNRILAAIPTIEELIKNKARLIICSHLGKPKGEPSEKFSLEVVAKRLSEILKKDVVFWRLWWWMKHGGRRGGAFKGVKGAGAGPAGEYGGNTRGGIFLRWGKEKHIYVFASLQFQLNVRRSVL